MAQGIECAGNHLTEGHGQRIHRIKEGEIRLCTPQSTFDLFFLVGDDGTVVHLTTCAEYRDDGAERNEFRRICVLGVLHFPDVLVQLRLCGDDLAAVGYRATSNGENQIDMILPCQLCTLLYLLIGGIGHDAGELDHRLALHIQNAHHFVIHTVALDGTASIGQHHRVAVLFEQAAQIFLYAALAEVHLGPVFKNKVVHPPYFLPLFTDPAGTILRPFPVHRIFPAIIDIAALCWHGGLEKGFLHRHFFMLIAFAFPRKPPHRLASPPPLYPCLTRSRAPVPDKHETPWTCPIR